MKETVPVVEWRQTRHQTARGARPDAQVGDRVYLLKNASFLRATYQIRLLTYLASTKGSRLIIRVPRSCKISSRLRQFLDEYHKYVRLEKV